MAVNPGDIWILGASGRIGRAIAGRLADAGVCPVLVGRDGARLRELASPAGLTTVTAGSFEEMTSTIVNAAPRVVINTIGPFTETALTIARSCPPGTQYVDLSNELPATLALLDLHAGAVAAGRTIVTGAGFGVLAIESAALAVCDGQPVPERLRVAAMGAVQAEPGPIGRAFAGSIVGALTVGGRRYKGGRLVRSRLLGDFEEVRLPDGRAIGTASGASGELVAAQRATGAPNVVAASSIVPAGSLLRAVMPSLIPVLRVPFLQAFAIRRIAAIKMKPPAVSVPQISWAHARAEWAPGVRRQAWLRTGDAMVFTAAVMAEVAMRLARGEGRPGAYTPGTLFGLDLTRSCGAEVILEATSRWHP